jgi:hypothetical protein
MNISKKEDQAVEGSAAELDTVDLEKTVGGGVTNTGTGGSNLGSGGGLLPDPNTHL